MRLMLVGEFEPKGEVFQVWGKTKKILNLLLIPNVVDLRKGREWLRMQDKTGLIKVIW